MIFSRISQSVLCSSLVSFSGGVGCRPFFPRPTRDSAAPRVPSSSEANSSGQPSAVRGPTKKKPSNSPEPRRRGGEAVFGDPGAVVSVSGDRVFRDRVFGDRVSGDREKTR